MIKKGDTNYRAFVGDFKPVNVFAKDNKVAGYVSESASGQELELSNTYNDSYEDLKIYGKSEQKAQWNQAEGVTTQVVTKQGKNLATAQQVYANAGDYLETTLDNKNCVRFMDNLDFTFDFPFQENTQYTVSFSAKCVLKDGETAGNSLLFRIFYSDGTYSNIVTFSDTDWQTYTLTSLEGKTITAIGSSSYNYVNYNYIDVNTFQLEKGSSATAYVPFVPDSPSPSYPSDLISNISAGSYQIPTENGIYEVTLTEDLCMMNDTYKNIIRFDSMSGTGYLRKQCKKIILNGTEDYDIYTSHTRGDYIAFYTVIDDIDQTMLNAYMLCNRYKSYGAAYANVYEGNALYIAFDRLTLKTDKKLLNTEDVDGFKGWLADNNVVVIYKLSKPVDIPLTFTKVESSTLPVLPWTAYGNNLFDGVFEYGFYDENGAVASTNYIRNANYIPVQPNTRYYFLNNKDDDTFLWYDSGKNFIAQVNDLSAPSPANARYLRFFFYGTDLSTEYMICNGSKPTEFESFNPTPPESLTPSPDYPQQIYDLSDVTVTSQGNDTFAYRCTSATINTELASIKLDTTSTGYYTYEDDEGNKYLCDYIYKDGDKVYAVRNVKTLELEDKYINERYTNSSVNDKPYYIFNLYGTGIKAYYKENGITKHWGKTSIYCTSLPVVDSFNQDSKMFFCFTADGVSYNGHLISIAFPKSEVDSMSGDSIIEKGKAYFLKLKQNGFTCTFKFIQEPVTTDITDTELGQAILDLKTAPYYTKLFADKETGGLEATYKHF